MARKQAKRRKQQKAHKVTLPSFPWRKLSALLLAIAIITLSYQFSAELLNQPIRAITIEGPFQRVSALQIEAAISDELASGFLSANLSAIQEMLVALPWIDQANVVRRWPGNLEISVTEQIPAASWGESGLLNTRGELFVSAARHVPAELPRLSGPEGQYPIVATRYLDIREKLLHTGLDVRRVHVDARGAWEMTLANGIDIRVGRRDVGERFQLFLDVAVNIISRHESEIEFVDMRYSNGFTIGWKNGSRASARDFETEGSGLVAGIIE
ncbi:MAG: cell division protein FtsQ/DivIB [Proteobacteria bacterium]|nr:cell division protein FtsQ/DivIB [Pseudomonadota bacterium]